MLERLVGLETEYALRFSPAPDGRRPTNDQIYDALSYGIAQVVHIRPGGRRLSRRQFFGPNGGAFYYEALPYAMHQGLIEGATPECRGPRQVVLYQRAQEAILTASLPYAERRLAYGGFRGELGLIKNCRDAYGHIYGAQENYECTIAQGVRLALFRAALIPFLLLLPIPTLAIWVATLSLVLLMLPIPLVVSIPLMVMGRGELLGKWFTDPGSPAERVLGRIGFYLEWSIWAPIIKPFGWLYSALAFRPQRRGLTAFMVSRPILTGTGVLTQDADAAEVGAPARFGLSEKGPSINRRVRTGVSPNQRPIFDGGNLMKAFPSFCLFRIDPLRRLFRPLQRLQIGLSDSNPAQFAEFLKVGTTTLVLDMLEAGYLDAAVTPRLVNPIAALHTIVADPSLACAVPVRRGSPMTALALQRWYLERAQGFVRESVGVSLDARLVVRLWAQTLDSLEHDLEQLFGRIDWVTKRALIESSLSGAPFAAQKKADLRYHELESGYFARLEQSGIADTVVEIDDVLDAMTEPPGDTPARLRSEAMASGEDLALPVVVSWDSVRIGGRIRGKVIRLDDYRRRDR